MITNRVNFKIVSYILFFLIVIAGCDKQQTDTVRYDGKNMQVNLTLPQPLAGAPIADLRAFATLDGGARHDLAVDPITNTVSGEITDVAAGTHELLITYYVVRSQLETILATVTKSVSVSAGTSTTVTVADNDLERNIDTDGDGFTNLAEVRSNTDPHDDADSPSSPPIYAVGHGSFGDATSSSYAAYRPCISADVNDNVHIAWYQYTTSSSYYEIRYIKYDSSTSSWGSIEDITSGSSYYQYYPSIGTDARGYIYITWFGGSPYMIYLPMKNRVEEALHSGIFFGCGLEVAVLLLNPGTVG